MSRILNEMHESMTDLYNEGLVDKQTMHNFDVLCLKTVHHLAPEEIKPIRENLCFKLISKSNILMREI